MHDVDFDFDFFVIGAGSGGVRAARTAAALGARTAIAEQRFFGGTCVNVGCIPKKLYTYAAQFAHQWRDAKAYGWVTDELPAFDWQILKDNKDKEIKRLNGIYQNILESAGVTIIEGRAELTGPNSLRVGDKHITARHILIATGGKPSLPDVPGIELAINSDGFFELTEQPKRAMVVGAGYIATELAGVFAGLGSDVHLVHRGNILLGDFDHEIAGFVTDAIQSYCKVYLKTQIIKIEKNIKSKEIDADLLVMLDDGRQVPVDTVLFATGRTANTSNLGLEALGVKLDDSGAVQVNEFYESSVPGIYAVGDVINRVTLTPVALAEGQLLARRLFGQSAQSKRSAFSYDLIASAVFSDPQLATVGLTQSQALAQYPGLKVYKSKFRPLKHTLTGAAEFTLMKMLVDPVTDRVVGVHMAGTDAAEIVQGMAVALQAGATKADFDATLGIHPTAAEEFVTMRTPVAD
ncbi:MAG: glutathione-disulfide reductase [Pseudohongiella sp.]|nr:glutathione-disulfide reductase [Pseudohongiella sp.]